MEIVLSARAEKNLKSTKEYITKEWGERAGETFARKFIDLTELLRQFPEMGSLDNKTKGIYGFQLTKQTRIFYSIKGNRIIILSLFDVRQNPSKKFL